MEPHNKSVRMSVLTLSGIASSCDGIFVRKFGLSLRLVIRQLELIFRRCLKQVWSFGGFWSHLKCPHPKIETY